MSLQVDEDAHPSERTTIALRFGIPFLLALATVAIYGQTVHFDFVHYDDHRYVLHNRYLANGLSLDFLRFAFSFDPATIHQGVSNWLPLTWLSYGLDVSLFGVDPGAMHGMNVGIHVLNTLLVFGLFERTTRSPMTSACVALLFAIHPLHVEAVAWIAERKELVAAFFGLLACNAWAVYATRGGRFHFAAAFACAALSLLAKPMWVSLPFLLLALDHWPLERKGIGVRRLILEKLPFVALSLAASATTLYAQTGALEMTNRVPFDGRVLNAFKAPIEYLALTIWPANLSVIYPHPYLAGGIPPTPGRWLLVVIAWLVIAVLAWRARSRGYLLSGLAWFLLSLGPVLGIVQVGQQAIADRYTYVPLLGIFALVSFGTRDLLAGRGVRVRACASLLVVIGFAMLGARGADQVGVWRDSIALYEGSVRSTPHSPVLRFNLGNRLADAGRESEAIGHLEAARRLHPGWYAPTANLAWLLATSSDAQVRDPARALALALEVTDETGTDPNTLDTLAAAYAAADDFDRAQTVAKRAVGLAMRAGKRRSARIYEQRRRLYAQGTSYVEETRPEERVEP